MLEHFSWSGYWTTIGTATALYYVAAGTVCYKDKITALLTGDKKTPGSGPVSPTAPGSLMGRNAPDGPEEEGPDSKDIPEDGEDRGTSSENVQLLDRTENVAHLVNRQLAELGPQATKEQVIRDLVSIVSQHNTDGALTPLRDAIDWHISQTSLDTTGIVLDEGDLDAVWNGAIAL